MEEKKLEDLTLKELQEMAVKEGMPEENTKLFITKAPLIATINSLKAARVVNKVDAISPALPGEDKQIEKKWRTKAERMRAILDAQPKVRFFIPCEGKEKPGEVREVMVHGRREYIHISGAIETVTLNGCKTLIPKGKFVDIPEQVAQTLSESMRLTQEAGSDLLLDRVDPKTGKLVRDQLE